MTPRDGGLISITQDKADGEGTPIKVLRDIRNAIPYSYIFDLLGQWREALGTSGLHGPRHLDWEHPMSLFVQHFLARRRIGYDGQAVRQPFLCILCILREKEGGVRRLGADHVPVVLL